MSNELQRTVIEQPLVKLLGKYKNQITEILPKQFNSQRVLKLIVGAINRNPALLQCTPMSVINAVLTAATMGLEIRPGSAYLIPYGKECTLIIDYRGKIDMVLRTGKVLDVDAEVVYSKEKFRLYRDEHGYKRIEHEPLLYKVLENGDHAPIAEADRGVPIGAYAVAAIKDGPPKVAWMPAIDIDKIRMKSRAKDAGPWKTDTMEMWKKTVVHRICKMLPQSPEIAAAQEVDDRVDADVSLENVIDFDPADDTGMPMLTPGSGRAAEEVAERKIDELRGEKPSTPVPQPEAKIDDKPMNYESWTDWEAAGSPEMPLIVVKTGENNGVFVWDATAGTYRKQNERPVRKFGQKPEGR